MYDIETIAAVRNFVELGGNVLFGIALLTAIMWTLIVERVVYFRTAHKTNVERVQKRWATRADHASWHAHQIRAKLLHALGHALLGVVLDPCRHELPRSFSWKNGLPYRPTFPMT